tara:strand:- start:7 stop:114 length:108 start_codon:yes stop_codon:yes gene_type:complete
MVGRVDDVGVVFYFKAIDGIQKGVIELPKLGHVLR